MRSKPFYIEKVVADLLEKAKLNDMILPGETPKDIVREVVLLRDKNTCQKCGSHKELEMAHLKYPDWNLNDLVTLCGPCHRNIDYAKKRWNEKKAEEESTP